MRLAILLTLIILSSVPIIDSFAQGTISGKSLLGWYQGSGDVDGLSAISHLTWQIDTQMGSESGSTDEVSLSLSPTNNLSFIQSGNQLDTILGITVDGITDVSGIGINICHSPINWKFVQSISVNGVPYDIARALSNTFDDHNTESGIFIDNGLRFEPSVIERFLAEKGVTLKSGDVIIWKVTASNSFSEAKGIVVESIDRTSQINGVDVVKITRGDKGTCYVSSDSLFLNDLTQEGEEIELSSNFVFSDFSDVILQSGVRGYSVGHQVSFTIEYLDATEQLIGSTTRLPDFDNDGIDDVNDLCTFTPETVNGFLDTDGCPDTIPPPEVEVTIIDEDTGEETTVIVEEEVGDDEIVIINDDGEVEVVLNLDFDSDNIVNAIDDCPNQAGLPEFNGCPNTSGTVDQTEFLQAEFDRIEADKPVTNVHIDVLTGVEEVQGESGICDPATENCDDVITQAIKNFSSGFSGIKLPFEPSIINFMILFGVVAGVVVVIAKVTKKI